MTQRPSGSAPVFVLSIIIGAALAMFWRSWSGGSTVAALSLGWPFVALAAGFSLAGYWAHERAERFASKGDEIPLDHAEILRAVALTESQSMNPSDGIASRKNAEPWPASATSLLHKLMGAVVDIYTWIVRSRRSLYAVVLTMFGLLVAGKAAVAPLLDLLGLDGIINLTVGLLSLAAALILPLAAIAVIDQAASGHLFTLKQRASLAEFSAIAATKFAGYWSGPPESKLERAPTSRARRKTKPEPKKAEQQRSIHKAILPPTWHRAILGMACLGTVGVAGYAIVSKRADQQRTHRVVLALGDGFKVRRDQASFHPGADIKRRLFLRHFYKINAFHNSVGEALSQDDFLDALIVAYLNDSVSGISDVTRRLSMPSNRDLLTIDSDAAETPYLSLSTEYRHSVQLHLLLLDNTLLLEAYLFESMGNVPAARSRYLQYYELVKGLALFEARAPEPLGTLARMWLVKAKLLSLDKVPRDKSADAKLDSLLQPLFFTRSHFLLAQYGGVAPHSDCSSISDCVEPQLGTPNDAPIDVLKEFAEVYRTVYGRSVLVGLSPDEPYSEPFACCEGLPPLLSRIERLKGEVRAQSATLAPFLDDVELMGIDLLRTASMTNPRWNHQYCNALTEAKLLRNGTLAQFDGLEILGTYLKEASDKCSNR